MEQKIAKRKREEDEVFVRSAIDRLLNGLDTQKLKIVYQFVLHLK